MFHHLLSIVESQSDLPADLRKDTSRRKSLQENEHIPDNLKTYNFILIFNEKDITLNNVGL